MTREIEMQKEPIEKDNKAGRTILQAFRFLEEIGNQLEALRKTLIEQLKSPDLLKNINLKIMEKSFRADDAWDSSGWLYRTTIDTFEICRLGKPGKPKTVAYAAFQISLAPENSRADEEFFPHVAILIVSFKDMASYEQWKCEEFQLDRAFLENPDDECLEWEEVSTDMTRWISKGDDGYGLALVVPLVQLKDEKSTQKLVIQPFVTAIGEVMKKSKTNA